MRRPGEAAAGGESTWRWLVASASASPSEASPSAPEDGRRMPPPKSVFIVIFLRSPLPSWSLLTGSSFDHAGTKKAVLKEFLNKVAKMAIPWPYARPQLKGLDAVLSLSADKQRVLVPVKEYCKGIPVLDRFTVPGAIPQKQVDGTTSLEESALLAMPAQEIARAVLLLLEGLFNAGYCLSDITDDSLLVDTCTCSVLLSAPAAQSLVKSIGGDVTLVDNTIAKAGIKLNEWIFTQNGETASSLPEVNELFNLMATSGNGSWYAIVNNMALVPLENRREVFIRMYEQLASVVFNKNRTEYESILKGLKFPLTWHDQANRDVNGVLFLLYSQAVYKATAPTHSEQAEQITRCFRNTEVHVFERLWYAIGRADVMLVHYAVAPLLASSLQTALQKHGWLVSTEIHTLIVYSRQSYT